MILVDSSVLIDGLRGYQTRQVEYLTELLGQRRLAIGDLMVAEVLQGVDSDRAFKETRAALARFMVIQICDEEIAIAAARNYRILRAKGVTVRKTIDTLIATRCIRDGLALLYSDRDFDPFVEHLGLIPMLDPASGVN